MSNRGAYFLANDRVMDLTLAFLNSFRRHNPDLPLCLVPFNDDVTEVERLRARYDFTIFPHQALLAACDDISVQFMGRTSGQFRKLAMWQGVFDEFTYIDVDTVVLSNIDFGFGWLSHYDIITSHSDIASIRKWVWKDTIFDTRFLSPKQINYAANTGFVISRRDTLTLDRVVAMLPEALALAPHMELFCVEQPLLNYLIVTSGKRYASLLTIARERGRRDIPAERWGGGPLGLVHDGTIVRMPGEPPVLLVHWAGEWQHERHESNPLWRYYRDMA